MMDASGSELTKVLYMLASEAGSDKARTFPGSKGRNRGTGQGYRKKSV